MFDDKTELSTDLEWMLQSGQVKIPSLVRALVREHYLRIFEHALAELSYPEQARQAADEILLTATQQSNRFRSDQGVQAWLDEIAREILRRRKSEIDRLSLLNPRLNKSLLKRYPVSEMTSEQIERAAERLLEQILHHRHLLDRRASLQEIFIACLAVLMVFGLLRVSGIFPPSAEESLVGERSVSGPAQEPDPVTNPRSPEDRPPAQQQQLRDLASKNSAAEGVEEILPFHPLRGIPPQAPLSLTSSHDDVWRRMLLSRFLWHSLWADLVVVLYGPEGYIGPPQAQRHQVWIEQDQNALLVSGDTYHGPERVELITPNGTFPQLTPFLQGVADISRLGSQIPWFYLSEDTIFSSPYLINFFFMGQNDWPPRIKEFQIVRTDRWTGRDAVVVEQTNSLGRLEARLWLDAAIGLILREQYFATDDPEQILLESVVTGVSYNQDFPADLFTTPEKYAGWYSSGQERTSQTISPEGELYPWLAGQFSPRVTPEKPPPGFDPGGSQLSFLYSGEIFFGPARATEVQVLAENYTLGKIKINHLYKTTCVRSPDGRLIGFFTQETPPSLLSDLLTLYRLPDLEQVSLTFPGNVLVRAAFSRDSRTLAVAGIESDSSKGRITLVNLQTRDRVEVPRTDPVWSLAWHPEGKQLAALHWPSFRQSSKSAVQITVYDLETKKSVRYNLAEDLDWGSPEVTIPLDGWQASFPLPMGGLEACASVPDVQTPTTPTLLFPSDQR